MVTLTALGTADKKMQLDYMISGVWAGAGTIFTAKEKEDDSAETRLWRTFWSGADVQAMVQSPVVDKIFEAYEAREAQQKVADAEQERKAAKIQEIKNKAKVLKEQLTEIKKQGLEEELLDKLSMTGTSDAGMEAKIATALDPVVVSFEQAEPPHIIRQRTEATIEKIKEKIDLFNKKEEALKVGAENILNLQQAGSDPSDINKAIQAFNLANIEKSDLGKEINGLCQILNGIDSTFEPMLIEETLPQIIPLIPLKVEMRDEKRYQRLVQEQEQNYVEREQRKNDWEIKDKAAKKAAKKEEELHDENRKFRIIPKPKLYKKWQKSIKDLQTKNQEALESKNRFDEINTKIYNNSKEQLEASAPKNPTTLHDKQLSDALFKLNFYDREVTDKTKKLENGVQPLNLTLK